MNAQQPPTETPILPLADPGTASLDAPRAGAVCPQCRQGKLDYNGLLELECTRCGYSIGGGGGCT